MLFADSTVSELTRTVDDAFLWIAGICVVLFVGIALTMIYFVVRYAHQRHPKAAQIEGNLPLEITWTVIPVIIVLFMFFKGYEGFELMRNAPDDAMVVEVVARSWFWTFNYPETGVSSDRLFVPVGRAIKLNLTAPPEDVIHSFYLPAFRVKEDCVPGQESHMWIQPERTGTFNVFCAEYCGKDHSKMITVMEVQSEEDFEQWMARKIADKNKPVDLEVAMDPDSDEIQSREADKLYETYCQSCHGKGGQGGLVQGARDFRTLENWKQGPEIANIFRVLTEGLDGTQMRAFNNLPAWDRFALAHKVASFYPGDDRPVSSDQDLARLEEQYQLGEQPEEKKQISVQQAMKAIANEAGGSDQNE